MNIKEHYRRFRRWQITPREYEVKSQAPCRCANCGHDVTTAYCPVCGQKRDVGRITWHTVRRGVMLLWGMDSRSLPYTLWQLLWRPGYLIRDYLKGRRKVSFPPVKMLFILALFSLLTDHLVGASAPQVTAPTTSSSSIGDIVEHFFANNLGWALLAITSLFILPTWAFFRHSPRYNRHTLPEGFFIQVFMSSLILILSIISTIIDTFSETIGEWTALFVLVYYYTTYHQLFGYGWWGTAWRFITSLFSSLMLLTSIIVVWKSFFTSGDSNSFKFTDDKVLYVFIGLTLVLSAIVLGTGYLIDKWTSRRREERISDKKKG